MPRPTRRRTNVILFTLAFVCTMVIPGLHVLTAQEKGKPMPPAKGPDAPTKWEYRILVHQASTEKQQEEIAAKLNKLGSEGWELVSAANAGNIFSLVRYVFKRPAR